MWSMIFFFLGTVQLRVTGASPEQCLRRLDGLAQLHQQLCKPDERPGECILRVRRLRRFAAHTRIAHAGTAIGRLLALETEHLLVHW